MLAGRELTLIEFAWLVIQNPAHKGGLRLRWAIFINDDSEDVDWKRKWIKTNTRSIGHVLIFNSDLERVRGPNPC